MSFRKIPIHVKSLTLKRFTQYEHQQLDLPDRGVVMITGPVGSGKSSLIEAVCHGLWGKSLRNEPCWQETGTSSVQVVLDDIRVTRTVTEKSKRLTFQIGNEPAPKHTTTTHAQADLDDLVGLFALWKRVNVFSATDGESFVRAKDKERKAILEQALSMGSFDAALKIAAREKVLAERNLESIRTSLMFQKQALEAAHKRKEDATVGLEGFEQTGDLDQMRALVVSMKKDLATTKEQLQNAQLEMRELGLESAKIKASMGEIDRRLEELDQDACPTCEQPIPPILIKRLRSKALDHRKEIEVHEKADAAERSFLNQEIYTLTEKQNELLSEISDLIAQGKSAASAKAQVEHWTKVLATVEHEIEATTSEIEELTAKEAEAEQEALHRKAAADVLGVRGVRSMVLGNALGAIAAQANAWLGRLAGPGYELMLDAQKELKSGAYSNELSLLVREPTRTAWHKFQATSGGERTFWDVAVMLGLGDVTHSAFGVSPTSTMFFDEVFKFLDDEKKERAIEVLHELSQSRCIVVITHDHLLKDRLNPMAHYKVEDGSLVLQ